VANPSLLYIPWFIDSRNQGLLDGKCSYLLTSLTYLPVFLLAQIASIIRVITDILFKTSSDKLLVQYLSWLDGTVWCQIFVTDRHLLRSQINPE
jgi:hypothetical protein